MNDRLSSCPISHTDDQQQESGSGKESSNATAEPGNESHPAGPIQLTTLAPRYKGTRLQDSPPSSPVVTFTLNFLKRTLGGTEYSSGLYFPAHSLTELLTEKRGERDARLRRAGSSVVQPKPRREKETWYAFDLGINPFVPRTMVSLLFLLLYLLVSYYHLKYVIVCHCKGPEPNIN